MNEQTRTEKSVNWSKAFCPVCQPIVDGHFRKREALFEAELERLQQQLEHARRTAVTVAKMADEAVEQRDALLALLKEAESYITHEAGLSVQQKAQCDPRNKLRAAIAAAEETK